MLRQMLRTIAELWKADLVDDRDTVELTDPATACIFVCLFQRGNHQTKRIMNALPVVKLANADDDGDAGGIGVHGA